jgi:EpsI family protein
MNKSNANLRFWLLLAVLLAGGVFVHWWQRAGEASVKRSALRDLPSAIGNWRRVGPDERFDAETEKVLRADDYVSRRYAAPDGTVISLYAGYYASQRNGATYHSPLNCLPGAGWVMDGHQLVTIQPADGSPAFTANRYVISNGSHRELLLYWYEGRGRSVASEYWGKFFTVWDSVTRRRSDGAMVRVMLPLRNTDSAKTGGQAAPEQELTAALQFAGELAPHLSGHIPD